MIITIYDGIINVSELTIIDTLRELGYVGIFSSSTILSDVESIWTDGEIIASKMKRLKIRDRLLEVI